MATVDIMPYLAGHIQNPKLPIQKRLLAYE